LLAGPLSMHWRQRDTPVCPPRLPWFPFLAATGNAALAEEATSQGSSAAPPTNEQLIEKLDRMEARIRLLENELHRKGEADAKLGSKARMAKNPRQCRKRARGSVCARSISRAGPNAARQKGARRGLEHGARARLYGREGNCRARNAHAGQ
jgi:hypothetical protein